MAFTTAIFLKSGFKKIVLAVRIIQFLVVSGFRKNKFGFEQFSRLCNFGAKHILYIAKGSTALITIIGI